MKNLFGKKVKTEKAKPEVAKSCRNTNCCQHQRRLQSSAVGALGVHGRFSFWNTSTNSKVSSPDVLVIGGGLCGLLVADRLYRRGVNCLVLEAGPSRKAAAPSEPAKFAAATKPLLGVDEEAWRYRTAGLPYDWIRVRALGGRSLLWGGWCERMDAQNYRDARALDVP